LAFIQFPSKNAGSLRLRRSLKPKKALAVAKAFCIHFADWTGLEPATSAVTGRHSNQLNYQSVFPSDFACSRAAALSDWECKCKGFLFPCKILLLFRYKILQNKILRRCSISTVFIFEFA
jgi:hypothetical protein